MQYDYDDDDDVDGQRSAVATFDDDFGDDQYNDGENDDDEDEDDDDEYNDDGDSDEQRGQLPHARTSIPPIAWGSWGVGDEYMLYAFKCPRSQLFQEASEFEGNATGLHQQQGTTATRTLTVDHGDDDDASLDVDDDERYFRFAHYRHDFLPENRSVCDSIAGSAI
jgi:hypothetical protein